MSGCEAFLKSKALTLPGLIEARGYWSQLEARRKATGKAHLRKGSLFVTMDSSSVSRRPVAERILSHAQVMKKQLSVV